MSHFGSYGVLSVTNSNQMCSMYGTPCRHCSIDRSFRPHTKLVKDPVTKLYKPNGQGVTIVVLGEYCNNVGEWVKDLHYCPARWALTRPAKPLMVIKPVKRTGKYAPTSRQLASGAWGKNRKISKVECE